MEDFKWFELTKSPVCQTKGGAFSMATFLEVPANYKYNLVTGRRGV